MFLKMLVITVFSILASGSEGYFARLIFLTELKAKT